MADEINQNPVSPEVPTDVFVAPTVEATQIETAAAGQAVAPVQVGAIVGPEVSVAEVAQAEPVALEIPASVETTPVEPILAPIEAVIENPTPAPDPQSGHLGGNDPIAIPETPAPEALVTPAQASSSVAPLAGVPILGAMRELFVKALDARQNRKERKLSHILNLFTKQTAITNDDVEKFLHVSDSTATRYLSRLEKEGKIKQGDKKGSGVSYTKV